MSSTPGTSTGAGGGTKRHRGDRHGWRADMLPLRKYTPTPTSGTAPLHRHHNYGFADFSPASSAMPENTLNERTIRYGFVDSPCVANEYVSSHDVVYDRLRDARVFQELQAFAAGVAQKQWARGAIEDSGVPGLPNRSVRSDELRDEWLRGLANARVPLSTLAGGVPFGLRGKVLLEALQQHSVPLSRALWAVRLAGVHEMIASQTRVPDHQSLKQLEPQYTNTWSRQFTQYIEQTLAAAPTGQAEPADAAAWVRGWEFCLALLHAQYSHGLLDQRLLVSWLVTQLRQAAVDKCMVLLPLVRDYTSEIARSRNPLRKLVAAVVFRIEQAGRYKALRAFHEQLGAYLAELFVERPDAFVEPSTWRAYKTALETAGTAMPDEKRVVLRRVIKQVDARNRRFACLADDSGERDASVDESTDPQTQLFRELGRLSIDSDIGAAVVRVFGDCAQIDGHRVRLVCYWASEDRLSTSAALFRQLVGARLCRMHLDRASQGTPTAQAQLQSAIVGFLDIFPLPTDEGREQAVQRVCLLLERLADVGCFSISKYLQLLTARGDFFGANLEQPRSQRHLAYVSSIPANAADDSVQRQMLMYDCSDTNIDETDAATTVCSQMRSELSSLLPFLVAYTCAAPLRAKGSTSSSQKCIDADIIRWWLPQSGELLDARALPSPAQLSSHRLQSPQAQHVCTKDWIAPVVDHFDDERALGSDTASVVHDLLMRARRSDVDLVVRRRLLPIIYDYVVKDVTVGVDNWRVITRPGTSLLNRRQTAVVISVLVEARYFAQLLDLLLWLLSHTRVSNIVVLVHATLRRFTWAWALLGKLPAAIAQVEQAYGAAAGADSFEFEYLRTAQHWYTTDPDLARDLHQRVSADYEAFADSHAPALVAQGGSHVPSQSGTGKELLQLAQQLVRDRAREAISSATDEIDWAILPCFQKLARIAFAATQRGDLGSSPGTLHFDFPSLPHGTGAHRPRLQAMLAHIVADTVRAAVSTGSTLKLNAAERASDEMLLRTFVDLCVMFIRWFSLNAGLLSAPENIGPAALSALSAAAGEWALSTTGSNGGSTSSLEGVAAVHNSAAAAEIEVVMFIGHALMGSMLSTGCIRVHELVPWLINRCRDQALPQSAAQHACVAGIIHALGEPASVDRALLGDDAGSCDSRRLYEALEIGACWATAFETHKLSRIQAVELVFTSAAASGKLRDIGQLHIAASLMHATSALARSWWIQAIIDCVPNADDSGYYTILEIYRANIEPQISDPRVSLPVKRAVLRALMTLCEGTDPTADGFSAMTTAEVAHRLHSTLRRFWTGTAFSSVHKLSAILNSLLLFAGSALRESEASTDAFAMAAGGARMIIGSAVRSAGHSRTASGQDGGGSLEQVQFVSDATTYVVACVLNAVLTWSAGSVGADDRLRARLAEALGTLAPDVVLQLVEACAHSLFALNVEQLHGLSVPGSDGSVTAGTAEKDATGKAMPVDQRMAALISASSGNVSDMVNSFIDNSGSGVSGNDYDDRNDVAIGSDDANVACKRGFALAQFIQQLVATLGKIPEDERKRGFSAGSTLAMVRDFAGGVLGQLQAIALHANASIAQMLALCITQQPLPEQQDVSLSPARLQMAVFWRFQAVRPLCHLMRAYPDEFGAGEWLTTLVTLSLAPACQPSGPQADNGLFQLLADFAAIVSESITAPMRKQALSLMRSVAPQLRSLVRDPKRADILSRLFPFEVSTVLTRGIAPRECEGLDNPWMWIEALEFTPLASLSSTAAMGGGLEGMTPFTLRGMLEQDNKARGAAAGVSTGYLANLRLCESNVSRDQQVAESRGLQYLENPYFPMQPAMLFPLAETPIPWQVFAAKRRRMDAETRLVWRSQCEAAFGSIP